MMSKISEVLTSLLGISYASDQHMLLNLLVFIPVYIILSILIMKKILTVGIIRGIVASILFLVCAVLGGGITTSMVISDIKKTPAFKTYSEQKRMTSDLVDTNDAQSFYDKGLKELQQKNWSAALSFFQQAAAKNPQYVDAWVYVGYCYGKLGRWQDAIEAFKQAIRIKPDDAGAHSMHFMLGAAYLMTGDKGSALEEYKILKTLDAEMANKLLNLIDAK